MIVREKLDTHIEIESGRLVIPEGLKTIPCTHGIHRFAGKFIPNLPRYLIRNILPQETNRTLLDPFCGSGTTLVEAALEGKRFIGLDIDPLSVAISTVKTQPLSDKEISFLEDYWENHDFTIANTELIPKVPNLNHWFSEKAIEELSSIKHRCLDLPDRLRLFCLIVFSSIIRRVSNADDQTQKTYVSHTLHKNPPLPSTLFPVFLARALAGMCEFSKLLPFDPKGSIRKGDAAADIGTLDFHDVITSPPYIDSIDYVYNQMLEYFWLLDELSIYSHENYKVARKSPMGFRTYDEQAVSDFASNSLNGSANRFEDICHHVAKTSPKESRAIRSFFVDYFRHVQEVRVKQKRGSFYISVVGSSLIRGMIVPTPEFIQEIHENAGYQLIDKLTYEIRRHYMKFPRGKNGGKIKQDHVLIFKRK